MFKHPSFPFSALILFALCGPSSGFAQEKSAAGSPPFLGKPLAHWISQANAPDGPADLSQTVSALTDAVLSPDPTAKRDAADALAALGPKAIGSLPALLAQLNHEFPWVRVSCQAAIASMGQQALPALVETFETQKGSPRILSAFIMGGLGKDAQDAVPAILRVMESETPLTQERLKGVLSQIDPERFQPSEMPAQKATYAPAPGEPAGPENMTRDWPAFHGPARDSLCRETGLLSQWPESGPRLLWTLQGLGRGYSTVSVAAGRLFTMGDRPGPNGAEQQFVLAFDLESRKPLWSTPIGAPHSDGGPRCTPTVDGDLLFALGTDGDLVCLETATGALRWHRNLAADFGGKMMSVWKYSESPLIDGKQLICTPGGPDAALVALDKHTGATIWKCPSPALGSMGTDGAGYASPVAATFDGVPQYVQMTGRGLISVEAATGRFLWGYNRIANTVANVTAPLVRGDYVFATTAYNTGAVLLKISRKGDQFSAEEVYFIKPGDFQNHHGGVVLVGDHLFGGHGPNKGDPACIEFGSGKILWKERAPAKGSAAVLYADGHLIYRYDRGEVLLLEASPGSMNIKGRFQTPEQKGPAWAHPVIHQGKLFLRHDDALFVYDVKGS